ncbi:ComEC/Rec2 family competence protein [Desulfohalovibrio reitneri]|uniref:ComEC/Rec2 family competence protein n=1 Tax=Desulfohalovibrio reitneri TaxID=1307759 RepID=UPI00068A1561|nr:MBL fold metallo-hydrolase [Desulfohalovibrio reitneri]
MSGRGGLAVRGMIETLRLGDEAGLAPTVAGARTGWLGAAGYWLFCCWLVSPRRRNLLPGALALALLAAPVASGWLERGVEVRLLDVGQGQAVLVRGPDGGRTLIDGGGFPGDFDVGEALVAPALLADRSPRLQRVLLSHPQVDHGGGLAWVAEHFDPELFASTGQTSDTRFMERLESALKSGGISTRRLRAGDKLDLGRGLRLEALHPAALTGDLNADSLVLRLLWNGRSLALLPGDVEGEGLKTLLRREANLSAELLVLPHHGSDNSLSPALYDRADPRVAAASCGYLGRFDFPGPKVRAAMARRGVPLLTTASRGELAFRWQAPDAPLEIRTRLPAPFPRDACQIGRVGLPSRPWFKLSAFSP